MIPEREARFVLLQMVSALRYLNNRSTIHLEYVAPPAYNIPSATGGGGMGEVSDEGSVAGGGGGGGSVGRKKTIIHFDLKPGNILFDEFGDVKVTGEFLSHTLILPMILRLMYMHARSHAHTRYSSYQVIYFALIYCLLHIAYSTC